MAAPGDSPDRRVPEPTLRRLPLYHRYLRELKAKGAERVSCTDIGLELNLDPTQVRKRPRIQTAWAADPGSGIRWPT